MRELPRTGGNAMVLLLVGLVFVLAGAAFVFGPSIRERRAAKRAAYYAGTPGNPWWAQREGESVKAWTERVYPDPGP